MCRSEKQIQTAICFSVSWVFHISCRTTTTYSNALAHHYHHPCSPRTNTRLKPPCTWPIQRLVINHVGLNLAKAAKTCQVAVLRCLLDGYACYSSREMRTTRVYQLRSFICCVTFIRRPFDLARSHKLKDLLFFAFLYLFRGFVCMQISRPFHLSISLSCRDGNCYWAPSLSGWLFCKQGLYLHPGVTESSLCLNLHCAHTHFISLIPIPVVSVAQWLGTGVIEERETWAGGKKINACSKPKSVCIPVSRGQFFFLKYIKRRRESQSESEPHSKTA